MAARKFSEEQARRIMGNLLIASENVAKVMQTAPPADDPHDGLGMRQSAIFAAQDVAVEFLRLLRPLLPRADELSHSDCRQLYPVLERLLEGRTYSHSLVSIGLLIQISCLSGQNMMPEEHSRLYGPVQRHLDQVNRLRQAVAALKQMPEPFTYLAQRFLSTDMPPNSITCQILGMIVVQSNQMSKRPS